MKRSAILLAIAAAAIGCSSGNKSAPQGDPTPVDPKTATLTLAAAFPGSGARSLIDGRTTSIEVWVDDMASFVTSLTLTPASPEGTLTVTPGFYSFRADAKDAGGAVLETAGTAGKVIAGPNTAVITFLAGTWTLGTPATLSNGWTVRNLYLAEDPSPSDGPAAFELAVPKIRNSYVITYDIDDLAGGLMGEGRIMAYTQFGGATVNRSSLDGGGYSLTNRCGESYDAPYPGSCPGGGGPAPGERWIRILGETGGDSCGGCSAGDRAVRELLGPESYYPDIAAVANARIVSGTEIAGTLIEYEFVDGSSTLLTGLTAPPAAPAPAPPMAPDPDFGLTVTRHDMAVVCGDGWHGGATDGVIDTGGWDTSAPGPDGADADSLPDYYEWRGYNGSGVGECDLGLEPASLDLGEWCDGWWDGGTSTCNGPGDGVALPWEFVDQNGDGDVATGSFRFSRLLRTQFQVAGTKYPFTATGTQSGGSSILVQ